MIKSGDFVAIKKRTDTFFNHIGLVISINGQTARLRVKYLERDYEVKHLLAISEGSEVS